MLKETYQEAWEEIDRDCKRNSEEEDEKELKLKGIMVNKGRIHGELGNFERYL